MRMIKAISSLYTSIRPLHFRSSSSPYTTQATSAASAALRGEVKQSAHSYGDDEYANVDWDNLGFGLTPADYMYSMKCPKDGYFTDGEITRYGNIQLSPAACVLNYGQAVYEGMKACRRADGKLLLFRPEQNAMRLKDGAERMLMPSPSVDQFVDSLKKTVVANKRWVPPPGKGFLYLRPLLLGSGPILGVGPAPKYTFLIYASPVRNNYLQERGSGISLCVEEEFIRAAPGGAGGVKSITNYAPVLKALSRSKDQGFSDVLYLDAVNKKYLEEVSTCNIFVVKGRNISTPPANGTILPGITRKSVMEIGADQGYEVEERAVSVAELMEADEVFCTGTAVGIAQVGSVTYQNNRKEYKMDTDSVCQELRKILVGIQTGLMADKKGWVTVIH